MAKALDLYNPDKTVKHVAVYCPACKNYHAFDERWSFNGDYEKPTFSPSMLAKIGPYPTADKNDPMAGKTRVCHSFVREGKIQFLSDCTHDMAGKTVELPEVEE